MSKFSSLGKKAPFIGKVNNTVAATTTTSTAVAEAPVKKQRGRPAKVNSPAVSKPTTAKTVTAQATATQAPTKKTRIGKATNAQEPTSRKLDSETKGEKRGTVIKLDRNSISFHDQLVNDRSTAEVERNAEELRKDISLRGLLQPLVVAFVDGAYCLCAGFSRYKAIMLLEDKVYAKLFPEGVPCAVAGSTLEEGLLACLAENNQREGVSIATVFNGVMRLKDTLGAAELAKAFRKSISTIRQYIQIGEDCHKEIVEAFLDGTLNIHQALGFAKMDQDKQLQKFNEATDIVSEQTEESVVQTSSDVKAAKEKAATGENATGPRALTKAEVKAFSDEFAGKAANLALSASAGKTNYTLEEIYTAIHLTSSMIAGNISGEDFSNKLKKIKSFTQQLAKSLSGN